MLLIWICLKGGSVGVCITCISWPFLGCSQVSSAPPYIIQLMHGWLMVLAMQHKLANRINCEWKVWKWVKVCRRSGLRYSLSKKLQSFQPFLYQTGLSLILHDCKCLLWCNEISLHVDVYMLSRTSASLFIVLLILSPDDSSPRSLLQVKLIQHRERPQLK